MEFKMISSTLCNDDNATYRNQIIVALFQYTLVYNMVMWQHYSYPKTICRFLINIDVDDWNKMNNTVFLNHVKLYRIVYRLKNLERKDVLLLTSNQLCGYKLKLAHVFFFIGNLNRFKLICNLLSVWLNASITNHWKKYQCKMYKWSQMHTKHHNNYSMIFWKMNRFEKKKKKIQRSPTKLFPPRFSTK